MHFGWNRLDREMLRTYLILKGFIASLRKVNACCNFGGPLYRCSQLEE
jgi:hypothetical protein